MFNKRLLKEFPDNQRRVVMIVLCQWISLLFQVLMIYSLTEVLPDVIAVCSGEGASGQPPMTFMQCASYVLLFALLAIVVRSFLSHFCSKIAYEAGRVLKVHLRERIYQQAIRLGLSYHEHHRTSELVQISTEGVDQLEIYFSKYVPQFFYALLAPITLFIVVAGMSVKIALILLVAVPLIPMSIVAVQKIAKKLLSKYWNKYTDMGDSFLEAMQGLNTLKNYQVDDVYAKRLDEEAENFRKVTMRVLIMQLNSVSIMDLVAYGGAAIGIVCALLECSKGQIGVDECLFIILMSADFFLPMRRLGSYFHIAMNGNAACEKIFAFLDQNPDTKDAGDTGVFKETENSKKVAKTEESQGDTKSDIHRESNSDSKSSHKMSRKERKKGKNKGKKQPKESEEKRIEEGLSLQHVSFRYPTTKDREGGYVLTDVSFTCPVGLNALVGESGSGKSTIVKLLCKELPLESGTITWMGRDYREIPTSQLRKEITQVDYHSYLFTGTLRENLLMGKQDATEEELWKVLSEVSMDEVVKDRGGLDAKVWERGANFSGGQRQRLAIARALLHDTKVMIFDEATSNIDVESESIILSLIHRLSKHKVILLISHRLANVVDANQILVLDHGLCVEHGTHEELMKEQSVYANLVRTQKELEEVGGEVS